MAPTTLTTPNYSLFSIPAYLFLAMIPHTYASTLLTVRGKPSSSPSKSKSKSGPPTVYNMANPRSSANSATYKSAVSPSVYARWERARAAHDNMLENGAFFVSAVLAGIVTKCDPSYMNRMTAWYLASRACYIIAYVSASRGLLVLGRTIFYFAGQGVLIGLWWEAGKRVMNGSY